jgi:hypothetical protein
MSKDTSYFPCLLFFYKYVCITILCLPLFFLIVINSMRISHMFSTFISACNISKVIPCSLVTQICDLSHSVVCFLVFVISHQVQFLLPLHCWVCSLHWGAWFNPSVEVVNSPSPCAHELPICLGCFPGASIPQIVIGEHFPILQVL